MSILDKINSFIVCRDAMDRRAVTPGRLPYMTEEGMVLIDRRGQGERRTVQRHFLSAEIGIPEWSRVPSSAGGPACPSLDL